jgi:hypothetical protein
VLCAACGAVVPQNPEKIKNDLAERNRFGRFYYRWVAVVELVLQAHKHISALNMHWYCCFSAMVLVAERCLTTAHDSSRCCHLCTLGSADMSVIEPAAHCPYLVAHRLFYKNRINAVPGTPGEINIIPQRMLDLERLAQVLLVLRAVTADMFLAVTWQ